ncbi:hypothetical protein MLD63_16260 [Paracoccus sp. TK19116]|uniref:Lipoprotein n=1 Tax=Paracoccus albicereus TaxID=2922394 RepID=A0ABT1MUI0_9RHOB|nr:hypothetical protein [Paracoccus albicereus]MCQ0971977.1 hypothetical protein [Paracoccus albicereus]
MKYPVLLLAALTVAACDDTGVSGVAGSGRDDFPEDVAACKQAMAFRESTTPTFIEVVSAAPLRDGSGIQMFVTHNGQNMTICRTDNEHRVTELFAYG